MIPPASNPIGPLSPALARSIRRLVWICVLIGVLEVIPEKGVAATVVRWCSPDGTGSGIDSSSPMALNYHTFTNTFLSNPDENAFVFKLLPSVTDYLITTNLAIPESISNGLLAQLRITIEGQGATPDAVRLVNRSPYENSAFKNPDYIIALNRTVPAGTAAPITADRIVIENLLLDGGWAWKMDQVKAPAFGQGYKNSPLNLAKNRSSEKAYCA